MNNRHLFLLLVFLLALVPMGTRAQQLVAYEYWFDGDLSTMTSERIGGYAATIDAGIPTQHLSDGLHTLYLRALQSDGFYSPVTSSVFFKHNISEGSQIEYWFDDDFKGRSSIPLPSSAIGDVATLTLNMQDIAKFPIGLHQLNMRVSTEGKSLNTIYSTRVLKLTSGEADVIEYWIDDDFTNRRSVSGHLTTTTGTRDFLFVDPFDLTGVPAGLHRIYYRATSESGLSNSAVTMTTVTVGCGDTPTLEYWIDDDRENIKTLSGHKAEAGDKGIIFNEMLNLNDVTAGVHRLNYRAVNGNGIIQSAISSTPIMVKSKYNVDPKDVKVAKYSIAVDDEEPMAVNVLTPGNEITIPYTLDARDLASGQHTLKAKFWNSVNAGVSAEQQFNVTEPETPALTLTATEKDGLVTLQYNAIPNDKRSRIIRVDANGVKAKVYESLYGTLSKHGDWFVDTPPAGTYTYYAQTVYEDFQRVSHTVKSNEVSVTVSKAQAELNNSGYIIGMVQQNTASPKWLTILCSDGTYIRCEDGKFKRDKIPAGTEMTFTVEGGSTSALALTYEPVTMTVKPGENMVYIKGQTQEDVAPNNNTHDLVFDSDLEWIGTDFKFMVRNWTKKRWKGRVRFRAISEKKAGDEEQMSVVSNFFQGVPQEVDLEPGKSTLVTLSLDKVFPDYKKDTYLFYIESIGKWTTDENSVVKLVGVNYECNVKKNPISRLIDKSNLEKAEDMVLMQNIEYAANLVVMIASKIKAFDGFLGNMDEYFQELQKQTAKLKDMDGKAYNRYLEDAMENESFEDILGDEMVQLIPKAALGTCGSAIIKKFRENVQSDILDKAWKKMSAKNVFKVSEFINDYLGEAMKMLKYIKGYRDWQNMSTYDRHFYCARAILDYGEKANPLCKVLSTYLDVAEAFVNKALEYGETYYGQYAAGLLYENIPSEKDGGKFDYNRYVDFKIEVQTSMLVNFSFKDFPLGNGTSAIKEVKVMLSNRSIDEVDTIYFVPVGVVDGVMLKQTKYVGIDPYKMGLPQGNIAAGEPLKRLWMEIRWQNGRTSKVPLLNANHKSNGVELKNTPTKPYCYIVRFKSGTTKYEHIADIIELKH